MDRSNWVGGAKIEAHAEEEQEAVTSTESSALSNISHSTMPYAAKAKIRNSPERHQILWKK